MDVSVSVVVDALDYYSNEGLGDDVRAYSGRGMYGGKCIGVVTESSPWQVARDLGQAAEQAEQDRDDVANEVLVYMAEHEPRIDSMGLSSVYYWTGLKINDEVEE